MARDGYNEGCLAAHALDLVGDRWALLVVRELLLGPRRFGQIKAGLPGIASNILTTRLASLEAAGLLRHAPQPGGKAAPYALTQAGMELREVLDALALWALRRPGHDPRKFISPSSLMLSMRAMYRAGPGDALLSVGFEIGADRFAATAGPEGFLPARTEALSAPLIFRGSANGLARAFYGPRPLAVSVQDQVIAFDGDPAQGQALVDRFALRREGPGAASQ